MKPKINYKIGRNNMMIFEVYFARRLYLLRNSTYFATICVTLEMLNYKFRHYELLFVIVTIYLGKSIALMHSETIIRGSIQGEIIRVFLQGRSHKFR